MTPDKCTLHGIALVEVVVDGGAEFKGEFTKTCRRLGISIHRLPPRSPDLNAFVERFQGTVLHLHYRTAFRYRFYTLGPGHRRRSPGVAALLQLRAAPPGVPDKGSTIRGDLLRRPARAPRDERMGSR